MMRCRPKEKKIELICHYCNEKFDRPLRDYRRHIKNGRTYFYCSLKCTMLNNPKMVESIDHARQYPKEFYEKMVNSPNFQLKKKDKFSPFREHLRRVRGRYLTNGIDFDIDILYLFELWNNQNGICPYTGYKMNHSDPANIFTASLDRIDSNLGYIKGNVEFVCAGVNFAKNKYDRDIVKKFFKHIKNKI